MAKITEEEKKKARDEIAGKVAETKDESITTIVVDDDADIHETTLGTLPETKDESKEESSFVVYDHMVKVNGVFYEAGEKVLVK